MSLLDFYLDGSNFYIAITVFSLLIGSFLNVAIFRLPIMLRNQWKCDCLEYLGLEKSSEDSSVFNLVLPRSSCASCGVTIKFYQNIPVISYVLLGGKCGSCNSKISLRYPIVELVTAFLGFVIAYVFGNSLQTYSGLLLTYYLIILSFIDFDHKLLPDVLTIPLLWLGLGVNLFSVFATIDSAVVGAIFGYLSLWTVFQVFKMITGKDGMGYGDFKLLSASGAWLGWQQLPLIIIMASVLGGIIGGLNILFSKANYAKPIPFGPFLALAIFISLVWGNAIIGFYLKFSGLDK